MRVCAIMMLMGNFQSFCASDFLVGTVRDFDGTKSTIGIVEYSLINLG